MEVYGFLQSPLLDDGFMMPIFKEGDKLYHQKLTEDNRFSYEVFNFDECTYDPLRTLTETSKVVLEPNINLNDRVYVFLDDDSEVYVGTRDFILDKSKSFKIYDIYKEYLEHLKEMPTYIRSNIVMTLGGTH